jgi:4'-phosphopantetheinyl transferase
VGRGLLRTILGNYLDVDPSQIEFVYGQYGKPAIKADLHKHALEFNLAHSQDMAVYAFSLDRRIGIDIEYVKSMPTMDEFAEQYFSFQENIYLNSLSGKQKEETFFKIWTCKEAFLKANGSGLTVPINQVETFIENDGTVVLLSVGEGKEQAATWRLEVFSPIPGYQAALAVEGHGGKVTFQNLKSDPPNE